MRIDTILQAASLLTGLFNSMSSSSNGSTGFSTALSKAGTSAEASSTAGASATATDRVLEKLNDYIQKGPIAAMREKILASMGLTEADVKALPPDKQQAVEVEVAERIKESVLNQQATADAIHTNAHANAHANAHTNAQANLAASVWAAAANNSSGGRSTG